MNPMYPIGNNMIGGPQDHSSHSSSPWLNFESPNTLNFLATLDILDLYKLTNDPIYHNFQWFPIPHKIHADILKFEGK